MKTDYKAILEHLKRTGRMKLLPQILRELKEREVRAKALGATVEVAHAGESAHALKAARALGIEAEHATVNASLIKGFRARSGSVFVDQSAKRALIDIYQRVTAN